MSEVELLNACCFKLIDACRETNADSMVMTQENVTKHGENLGTWKITVERSLKDPQG